MYSQYSQSIQNIEYRNDGTSTDKYLRIGQTILVRKFDPAVIDPLTWNELWIGLRWRFDTEYDWKMQSGSDKATNDPGQFYIGPCVTSGVVYGEPATASYGHFLALALDNLDVSTATTEMTYIYTASIDYSQSAMIGNSCILIAYENGTRIGGNSKKSALVVNRGDAAHADRGISIYRFINTNSSWSFSAIMMAGSQSKDCFADKTSSAILGELFKIPTWELLTASVNNSSIWGASNSYIARVYNSTGDLAISRRSIYGYFDGIFLSYNNYYDNYNISDIIVKAI